MKEISSTKLEHSKVDFKTFDSRMFVLDGHPVIAAAARNSEQLARSWSGKGWDGNWNNRRTWRSAGRSKQGDARHPPDFYYIIENIWILILKSRQLTQ